MDDQPVFAVIRGDLEVNELKLLNAVGGQEVRSMLAEEVAAAGWVAGYASPVGLDSARVVADSSVVAAPNLVGGANREGYHVRNLNYGRDWTAATVADIGLAQAGDVCAQCGDGRIEMSRGVELGHIFRLGEVYAEPMNATYLNQDGERMLPVMGCYGIGLERLLAAVVQANHDDHGIVWPPSVAPYDVHIVAIGANREDISGALERLEAALSEAGLSCLSDDRDERPGVKFNDADLIGAPLRITLGPRGLRDGEVELKLRSEAEARNAPLESAASVAREALTALAALAT